MSNAIQVLTNVYFAVTPSGGSLVELSHWVKSLSVPYGAKAVDATKMGDDTENFLAGLKTGGCEVEFLQDFGAGYVDATLFPLVGPAVAPMLVTIRPVNTTKGGSNPEFNFSAMIESYPPLGVSVGGISPAKVTFKPSGGTAATLLRTTS